MIIYLAVCAALFCPPGDAAIIQSHAPVANPAAIVVSGNARFTVLLPSVIRMEWAEDGVFEDRATLVFINRNLPVPEFTSRTEEGWLVISTDLLTLRYKAGSGAFSEQNLEAHFKTGGMEKTWRPGETDGGNLRGTLATLDDTDGDHKADDENKKLVLEPGLISRDGWVMIDDTGRPVFDNSDWPWVQPRPEKNHQDFYFFAYGHDYRKALSDFTAVAGKIPMPPRFVFGYWFSLYRAFSEMEFREMVDRFESLDIPLDVLVVDMDWHLTSLPEFFVDGKRGDDQAGLDYGWTGFTWNRNYFPNPKRFLEWADSKGLKNCLNLHPASGFQPHEEKYAAMAEALGIDPASKKYVPFDITNKTYAEKYFDIVLRPMEEDGVDFWWLDWQQWSDTKIPGVNPIFYLNYVHFTQMERQGKKRQLIYHRWGGLGNHRYQIGFSGDTKITWASLDYQPYFTINAANVLFGYWGNDIGGHYGEPDTPELFTRWFQFGVFSPILKTHATCDPALKRKLWEYPHETFFHLKDLIQLRYALIPYIYSAAREAYDTGVSLCRPMYYDYPEREQAYQFRNEYFFGDEMIVNPVTHPIEEGSLCTMQKVWLPEGEWIEWFTGAELAGDTVVERPFMIDEVPVYVRTGAIIPMQPKMRYTGEKPVDPLILTVFPGPHGRTSAYEDDGDNDAYKQGEFTTTTAEFALEGRVMTLVIEPVEGAYPGMLESRGYELRLPNSLPPVAVGVNGNALNYNHDGGIGWDYDGFQLTTIVRIPAMDAHQRKEIRIEFPAEDRGLVNGKKRRMAILFKFSKFLSDTRNFFKQDLWNDAFYSSDLVMHAAQTGLRISENPERAAVELRRFEREWEKIVQMLAEVSRQSEIYIPYYELMK
jgi:alpha-glucosidase (family GH31 glycosyl hydrolase)